MTYTSIAELIVWVAAIYAVIVITGISRSLRKIEQSLTEMAEQTRRDDHP